MRIIVLGGAGAMARVTVRDLLASGDVKAVGVADVDVARAKQAVARLKSDRAEAIRIDVRNADDLRRVLRHWDVAINSTWYELNLKVMNAAIAARVDYVDLGGLYHMSVKQLARHDAARKAGVTCLIGMGSTPGTMNVMAAHGATRLDRIDRVTMASASAPVSTSPSDAFVIPYAVRTILDEFSLDAPVFREGKLQFVPPLSVRETLDLPEPIGRVEAFTSIHSELATLPHTLGKGVRNIEFLLAFPREFQQAFQTLARLGFTSRAPVRIGKDRVVPYEATASILGALPRPTQPVLDVDFQRCTMAGTRGGVPTTLIYDCISRPDQKRRIDGGSLGTGTPPSIAAQWMANGKVEARGVVPPEIAIDPLPYFEELGRGRPIEVWERDDVERVLTREE